MNKMFADFNKIFHPSKEQKETQERIITTAKENLIKKHHCGLCKYGSNIGFYGKDVQINEYRCKLTNKIYCPDVSPHWCFDFERKW